MIILVYNFSSFLTQVFNRLNIDLQKERIVTDHLSFISWLNQITNRNRLSHLSYLAKKIRERETVRYLRDLTY